MPRESALRRLYARTSILYAGELSAASNRSPRLRAARRRSAKRAQAVPWPRGDDPPGLVLLSSAISLPRFLSGPTASNRIVPGGPSYLQIGLSTKCHLQVYATRHMIEGGAQVRMAVRFPCPRDSAGKLSSVTLTRRAACETRSRLQTRRLGSNISSIQDSEVAKKTRSKGRPPKR
jgi:hypothetical protein